MDFDKFKYVFFVRVMMIFLIKRCLVVVKLMNFLNIFLIICIIDLLMILVDWIISCNNLMNSIVIELMIYGCLIWICFRVFSMGIEIVIYGYKDIKIWLVFFFNI